MEVESCHGVGNVIFYAGGFRKDRNAVRRTIGEEIEMTAGEVTHI